MKCDVVKLHNISIPVVVIVGAAVAVTAILIVGVVVVPTTFVHTYNHTFPNNYNETRKLKGKNA